jgi:hypothetical protein
LSENTREEEDDMRATTAPCGRVCGSRTQDKTNEKGKRKSERHDALCEAEHRKTKKKKQTQKHNQQKRKRHRETDTLRADAGKKLETPSNQSNRTVQHSARQPKHRPSL